MKLEKFKVSDQRLSFRSLVSHQPKVYSYAGVDFVINNFFHIRNRKGSVVSLTGESFPLVDGCSAFLYISGDVITDKILECRVSNDYLSVLDLYYNDIVNSL